MNEQPRIEVISCPCCDKFMIYVNDIVHMENDDIWFGTESEANTKADSLGASHLVAHDGNEPFWCTGCSANVSKKNAPTHVCTIRTITPNKSKLKPRKAKD